MVKLDELSQAVKEELAFTPEELRELEEARKRPITFDEDCPETTPERAVRFRRVNPPRGVSQGKQPAQTAGASPQNRPRRFGFLAGRIRTPDNFDRMDEAEIARLFGAETAPEKHP